MGAVAKTIGEAVAMLILAFVTATVANDVRPAGRLDLWTDHFRHSEWRRPRPAHVQQVDVSQPATPAPKQEPAHSAEEHPEHGYQEISFDEVVAAFDEATTAGGANIFVDARGDEAYEAGHIPSALQCNHYRLAEYIEDILHYAYDAEKIIIYCNGGNCEDSIFVCGDLEEFDIPYETMYLYKGGWQEWCERGQPMEMGSAE